MMLAKVCSLCASPTIANPLRTSVIQKVSLPTFRNVRFFANEGRSAFTRSARSRETMLEKGTRVAPETASHIGTGIVAGASLIGIGALGYYGLGLSSTPGAIDRSAVWPQYVQDRIHSTYMYLGSSVAISVASAAMAIRSPTVMRLVTQGKISSFVACIALLMGTGIAARSIPYEKGMNTKHLAWLAHSAAVGAVVAPLYSLGGPILLRAACYTAGIVFSLSTIAACAPSDKFLTMAGPLSVGLGIVFASSVASMFLPPTTALGASLHSVVLYGGLVLFSLLLLYDTQKLIKKAEMTPPNIQGHNILFDPIHCSIDLYMDIINIFVRMVMLTGNHSRK